MKKKELKKQVTQWRGRAQFLRERMLKAEEALEALREVHEDTKAAYERQIRAVEKREQQARDELAQHRLTGDASSLERAFQAWTRKQEDRTKPKEVKTDRWIMVPIDRDDIIRRSNDRVAELETRLAERDALIDDYFKIPGEREHEADHARVDGGEGAGRPLGGDDGGGDGGESGAAR